MVLKKSEGQLSINRGFGSVVQFGLSEDKDTLMVADQSYKRISINRLNEIKEDIKNKKEEREKNNALCSSLIEEYKEKKNIIMGSYENNWEISKEDRVVRDAKLQELLDLYKPKEKTIPNCRAWLR